MERAGGGAGAVRAGPAAAAAAVAARADPQEKEILHRYATWHVLRRLRHRTRSTHATHCQAGVARRNITAAATFLNWLTARDLTLATCPQADLDQWMADASTSQRGPTGHFIRWARNQKLTSLDFPAARWAGPTVERRGECLPGWPVRGVYRADGERLRGGLVGGGTVPIIAPASR